MLFLFIGHKSPKRLNRLPRSGYDGDHHRRLGPLSLHFVEQCLPPPSPGQIPNKDLYVSVCVQTLSDVSFTRSNKKGLTIIFGNCVARGQHTHLLAPALLNAIKSGERQRLETMELDILRRKSGNVNSLISKFAAYDLPQRTHQRRHTIVGVPPPSQSRVEPSLPGFQFSF